MKYSLIAVAIALIAIGCKFGEQKKARKPPIATGPSREVAFRVEITINPQVPGTFPAAVLLNPMVIKLDWQGSGATWPWNGKGLFTGQSTLAVGAKLDFVLSALGQDGQTVAQKKFSQTEIAVSGDLKFALTVDETALKQHVTDTEPATPGDGGTLQVSDVREDSFRIRYASAFDNQTFAADLRYAVYLGEAREVVADPQKAATKARLVQDWSPANNSVTITGLTAGRSYFVLVVVRDRAGNLASYEIAEQKAINDSLPPVLTNNRITISEVSDAGAVLSWGAATDNLTDPAAIRYQVVSIYNSDEQPAAGPRLGATRMRLTGLNPATKYTVNVYAVDGAQNRTAYQAVDLTTPAAGGVLTLAEYAGQCAKRLGRLKPVSCLDAEMIPITVNGKPLMPYLTAAEASQYRFGGLGEQQTCDKPTFLELGAQGQCIPYARVMRLDSYRVDGTKQPDVESIMVCRRYVARLGRHAWMGQFYDGSEYPGFEDVAIIQHHRITGETCWFQALAPLGEAKDARRVPPPDEASLPPGSPAYAERAETFWLSPTETARRDCVKCHDSDPWMHSPYIDQVRHADGSPLVFSGIKGGARTGRYSSIGTRHFTEWTLPQSLSAGTLANGNSCTNCHELGDRESCARWIAHSVARVYPPNLSSFAQADFHLSRWMPPAGASGENLATWEQAGWREAADRLLTCCTQPTAPGCSRRPLISPPPPYAAE